MSRQCITHHLACDCREAKFKRLIDASQTIRTMIDDGTLAAAYANNHQESIGKAVEAFDALDQALNAIGGPA